MYNRRTGKQVELWLEAWLIFCSTSVNDGMAAHFAPPLPCILLALEQSETHVNEDPKCQPATSLLALNNTASLNTLASAYERAPPGFQTFKRRERAQKQRVAEGRKPRLKGPVRYSKTSWAFTVVNGVLSSSNNNRERRGVWMGYRQKTRTDVSINWGSCGASLLSLSLSCSQSKDVLTLGDGQIHQLEKWKFKGHMWWIKVSVWGGW